MASTINASTSAGGGVITTADSSGALQLQTASTTALTLDTSQNATFAKNVILNGSSSGTVTLTAPAVAGTTTLTLPSTSGTIITTASSTGISGSAISTGTVGISVGGTGQTTASAAFNALSPITTTGDLIIGNGTNSATRLAIGTNNQVLTSNGTTAVWGSSTPAAGSITDAMISTIGTGTFDVKYNIGTITAGNTGNVATFIYGVKIGRNITLQWAGTYNFGYSSTNQTTYGYVYKNGINQGTLYGPITNGGSSGPFSGSLNAVSVSCVYGDVIQIYHQSNGQNATGNISSARLLSTANSLPYVWFGSTDSSVF